MSWMAKPIPDLHFPALVKSLPSQTNKIVAITGTTSGTGFVAAGAAAGLGAHVVLLNRPSARAVASLQKLQAENKEATFTAIDCDMQDFASVRSAAATIKKQFSKCGIDVLINNAGVMALPDQRTKDGHEIQMQTNHLSSFLLVKELLPLLNTAADRTGEARVVNHSSGAARGPALEQKYFEKSAENETGGFKEGHGDFNAPQWARYHQTKLANVVFTNALADGLEKANSKIIATVAHPGLAATELQVTTTKAGGIAEGPISAFMGSAQSAGDGACGILSCAFKEGVKARDFWGPVKMTGEAVLNPFRTEEMDKDSNKELLWRMSTAATAGDMFSSL